MKSTYDGYGIKGDAVERCGIGEDFNADKPCIIEFTVPKDMEPPVMIHYEITNFFQNHRSYYQSRDNYQLRGLTPEGAALTSAELACKPLYSVGGVLLYPCGLAANTMFNDIFTLEEGNDIFGNKLELLEEGIAWGSDVEYSFQQKEDFRSELCAEDGSFTEDCCDGEEWSCTNATQSKKNGFYYRYFYPNEDTTQYLYETYPDIVSPLEGVTNEHFIVWMRIAAHDRFRKLYGWIDQPIAAGTKLKFKVRNNYVVTRFRGTKSLIVGNTSIFGGRNEYLADMFLGVGYFCIVAGVLFSLKHAFRPRKLGDKKYLHYKEE